MTGYIQSTPSSVPSSGVRGGVATNRETNTVRQAPEVL
jgi:hypothetical protein